MVSILLILRRFLCLKRGKNSYGIYEKDTFMIKDFDQTVVKKIDFRKSQ